MVTTRGQASRLIVDSQKDSQQHKDKDEHDKQPRQPEEQQLPHPKPLLAPELDLLRWTSEMREKLDRDGTAIGSHGAQLDYFYESLRFQNREVIKNILDKDIDKCEDNESGDFNYRQTLQSLEHEFRAEIENQRWIKTLDAKPGQKIHLLDLPPEIVLCIAEWCHLQPRRTTCTLVTYISDDSKTIKVPIGGGLDRLSQVNKFVRSLVVPIMFSRIHLSCTQGELIQRLDAILDLKKFLPHVQMFTLAASESKKFPHSESAAARSKHKQCARSLVSALKAMNGLREFSFYNEDLEDNLLAEISNLVHGSELRLPLLTGLEIVRNCNCQGWSNDDDCVSAFPFVYALAHMGPNVERASLDFDEFFKTRQLPGHSGFGDLPKLMEARFVRGDAPLSNANVMAIVEAFPRLQRLDLPDALETRSPESLIPILSLLTNPELLALCVDPENPESFEDYSRLPRKKCIAEELFLQCPKLQHIYLKSYFSSQIGHTTDAFVRLNHSERSQQSKVLQPWVENENVYTSNSYERGFPPGGNYEVSPIWDDEGFPRITQLGWWRQRSASPKTWSYFKDKRDTASEQTQSKWIRTEVSPSDTARDVMFWEAPQSWDDFF